MARFRSWLSQNNILEFLQAEEKKALKNVPFFPPFEIPAYAFNIKVPKNKTIHLFLVLSQS